MTQGGLKSEERTGLGCRSGGWGGDAGQAPGLQLCCARPDCCCTEYLGQPTLQRREGSWAQCPRQAKVAPPGHTARPRTPLTLGQLQAADSRTYSGHGATPCPLPCSPVPLWPWPWHIHCPGFETAGQLVASGPKAEVSSLI